MNPNRKVFLSQSIGNIRFSQTNSYFYKNKYKTINISNNIPNSIPEYKSLFRSYYKSKINNNNNRDSYNEINKYYLKCQDDVKNYITNDKNKLGLKLEGNKILKNYSINRFKLIFNKACSARERILQHQILNYYYPKNNDEKLMGKNMKLTPIPSKRNSFLKNQKEREEYIKAKRAAVCMRRLEYTHGLRKNKSQELEDERYKNKSDKVDFLSVLKGAVLIIEDWWIKILNRRKDFIVGEMSGDDLLVMEGRGTTNSIEKNILKQLSYDMNNENSKNQNSLIENWLSSQSKRLIQKNDKNLYNRFKFYNYNSLNIENQNKKVIKTPKYKKNKQNKISYKTPKNSSETLFKEYYKSVDNDKKFRNKNTITIRRYKNGSQNPIKIIQNSVMIPPVSKISTQTITPSSYLQNYFKDYCLNNDNHFTSKTCSHKSLKSFEFIENKYNKNRYKEDKIIQYPYSLWAELMGNSQNEIIKYRSFDNIEDNINIGDEINDNNININKNNNSKEIIKYKTIESKIHSDIINGINNDMNIKKIDNSIDEVIIDDNTNGKEINEEKNKKRQILRGQNKRRNNNNNIDYDNNNIMSDNSDNITVVDNLLNNNKYNDNINNINNINNIINNIKLNGKKNSFNRNNVHKNDNFNKEEIISDVEPVKQNNMNNIIDIVNDINSNININELNKQAKRQYIIKYNIIQNLNGQNQNNPMSERSSMDGSVDEIITRKLIEIHRKNKKYQERIKKAYNQVKSSKTFNEHKVTFLNNMKVDCSDSIHNIEESDY